MKKSFAGNQTLDLNRIDFEKAGSGRKAGYKFTIDLVNGRVSNVISGSPLASDLAAVLLSDPASKAILASSKMSISLNTKFQLVIMNKSDDALQLQEAQKNSGEKKED
jgi:hypothetical protein